MNISELSIKLKQRKFFSYFSENPRDYSDELLSSGKDKFENLLNSRFEFEKVGESYLISDEISPFLNTSLNISYPVINLDLIIENSLIATKKWQNLNVNDRYKILFESLELISQDIFEIAFATMHTTGQSFIMSFQASGPHALDRALESLVLGYEELTRYESNVKWSKDFGKFTLDIEKDYQAIGRGIGLVIGCSTFPTWNSVTGIYANLICGNPVIVKPHPKSILPIALFVRTIRQVLLKNGIDPNLIQLAVDTLEQPITKVLAENENVRLIDYTGGNSFGDYIEKLDNKITFTEKAGVNCCIIDSTDDMDKMSANLAFSISLYSGQMCTAPQNVFIPKDGILVDGIHKSFKEVKDSIVNSINSLIENPKSGAGTAGAIQNSNTTERINTMTLNSDVILESKKIVNPEFPEAITASPLVLSADANDYDVFSNECFGPIIYIIQTESTNHSIDLAKKLGKEKGALTCLAYCTNEQKKEEIKANMNSVFVPVSFNFKGAGFVNQHAAFSDFHVTGGNPAGNATFTNPEYIVKRFVWVGNRYM